MSRPEADFAAALAGELEGGWIARARPNQLAPAGDWFTWLLLAGRGFGKTRVLSEFVGGEVAQGRAGRIALVAATGADARDVMVEGESGILACAPPWHRPEYEPSRRRLTWPNGAIATTYSADEPERLRGPQHDLAACDELASWRRPVAWDNLMFGLRLGERPRCVVATTPRPVRLVRELCAREGDDVVITRGTSYENRANLAPAFLNQIVTKYEGTRLGRQELLGELLTDTPGALWTRDRLEELRRDAAPVMSRIVVAIDPAGSAEGDETGIIAAGVDEAGRGWLLADESGQYQPTDWARRAVALYHHLHADRVVAETNFGGGMVEATIRAVDPNVSYRAVTASRGKVARAEPVSALYEQGRVHHLGVYPELEDQLCGFTSHFDRTRAGFSPGRLDALVWALTELLVERMASEGAYEFARQEAEALGYRTERPALEVQQPESTAQPPDFSSTAYLDEVADGVKRLVLRDPRYRGFRGPLAR
jgi:phage terminase large subunit-like protein